tara:strand:+ start:213 stop:860 length:648 start_codon:yes stop_codon:yes gene_type:complete
MKTFKTSDCEIFLHDNDLPSDIECEEIISVDTETTGLSLVRDQLCLIQIGISSKECHMVKFERNFFEENNPPKNLVELMKNDNIKKIFHYARFDVAMIKRFFGVYTKNNFCTKIASKLVRTYTDKHGLKDLCKDLLNIDLNKSQQTTDWFSEKLTENQLKYAANDVIHLFDLKNKLEKMLIREKRLELADKIFSFIPSRVELDLLDWHDIDIFSH